jgi:hypothetical protein
MRSASLGGSVGPFFNLTGVTGFDPAWDQTDWIYCCGTPTPGYATFSLSGNFSTWQFGGPYALNDNTSNTTYFPYTFVAGNVAPTVTGFTITVTQATTTQSGSGTCDAVLVSGSYVPGGPNECTAAEIASKTAVSNSGTNCSQNCSGQAYYYVVTYTLSSAFANAVASLLHNGVIVASVTLNGTGSFNSPAFSASFNTGDTISLQIGNPSTSVTDVISGSWTLNTN